jgi:hypothetical protein
MIGAGHRNAVQWKVAANTVALFLVLALTACDPLPSTFDRIGVTSAEDGSVQILYLACDYERLAAVALYDGDDPTTGEDDVLLWEIRSEDGGDGGVFTVGSQREGYVETVAFEGELTDNLIAVVEVVGSVGAVISFAPTDLKPGMVFARGTPNSSMDAKAFEQRTRESCERQYQLRSST